MPFKRTIKGNLLAHIWLKTEGFCYYCGASIIPSAFAVDHVIPRVRGGSDALENLVPACKPCNDYKAQFSLEEYRVFLTDLYYKYRLQRNPNYICEEYKRLRFWFEDHHPRADNPS